ncbi:7 transmembrane receptor [Trichostrongylus colubriformis]|uniref:7 transmembrane receptor n=1 Tax=Trichostrongylus colubriformis TaxID=6319 RepID=A0AAN8FVM1_TRICO
MWTSAFNFLLSLLIFAFNLLVLIAISSDKHLHSTTHLLSCNLWLCNCISAIVTIFFSLTPSYQSVVHCSIDGIYNFMSMNSEVGQRVRSWGDGWTTVEQSGAHAAAVLLNSTVSLLSLLTIGVVHALSRHNYHLSKCQSSRLLASSWILVVILLLADFLLVRTSRSLVLAVPFHLALLSVFLVLNLVVHPLNLILLSRARSQPQDTERVRMLEESATAALWLLLNSLSFAIIVMMVLWESKKSAKEVDSIMGIEMAAYSVHCIANPLIAVIRDRRLESTLAHILMRNKRHTPDEELIVALMRDPPPPYST